MQAGQFIGDERAYSHVLQANRVDHPRARLPKPGRRIALDGVFGKAFDNNSAQRVEIDQFLKLEAVTECARGSEHGVAKTDAADRHFRTPTCDAHLEKHRLLTGMV